MRTRTLILASAVSAAVLFSTGCSAPTVIDTLNSVVSAGETAIPVLEAQGDLSATTAQSVDQYLSEAATASQESAAELKSSDSAAQKFAVITADFASVVLPDLSGVSPQVAGYILAVDAAVKAFLSSVQVTSTAVQALHVSSNFGFADRVRLRVIESHAKSFGKHVEQLRAKQAAVYHSVVYRPGIDQVVVGDGVYHGEPLHFSDGVYRGEPVTIRNATVVAQ